MKQYNGECAIISMTSWKERINTVGQTIFSLIKQCPGFHIVLVLSEEEFPNKEAELPKDLLTIINNNLIELLWVYKNYKSFKKVLFTMDKYKTVPIISADDDCIYICNYAQDLYNKWKDNKTSVISYNNSKWNNIKCTWGCATLYPPYYFNKNGIKNLTQKIIDIGLDDNYYMVLRYKLNLKNTIWIGNINKILKFYNEIKPLHNYYIKNRLHEQAYKIYNQLIKI